MAKVVCGLSSKTVSVLCWRSMLTESLASTELGRVTRPRPATSVSALPQLPEDQPEVAESSETLLPVNADKRETP